MKTETTMATVMEMMNSTAPTVTPTIRPTTPNYSCRYRTLLLSVKSSAGVILLGSCDLAF